MTRPLGLLVAVLSLAAFLTPAAADTPATKPTTRPATNSAPPRTRADRIAAAKVDVMAYTLALDAFEIDNGRYPTTDEGLQALAKAPDNAPNWHGPYAKKITNDPWGHPYVYLHPGQHNTRAFDLSSLGEDGKEGTLDDVTNWDTGK